MIVTRWLIVLTRVILGRPPEDLWSFFDDFSPSHVAAMAPCLYHYDTPRNKVRITELSCDSNINIKFFLSYICVGSVSTTLVIMVQ